MVAFHNLSENLSNVNLFRKITLFWTHIHTKDYSFIMIFLLDANDGVGQFILLNSAFLANVRQKYGLMGTFLSK